MTQFALVKMGSILSGKVRRHFSMHNAGDGFVLRASSRIFKDSLGVLVLSPYGRPFDEVYLSAQRAIAEGVSPDETDLFLALDDISSDASAVALWYGDDFFDLPVVTCWKEFLSILRRDLEEPSSETYVVYSKKTSRGVLVNQYSTVLAAKPVLGVKGPNEVIAPHHDVTD